jgi:hypothetical protein
VTVDVVRHASRHLEDLETRMVHPTRRSLFQMLGGTAAYGLPSIAGAEAVVPPWPPTPAADRQVGIAYSLWHYPPVFNEYWQNVWGMPMLGHYRSDDRSIIRQHAAMLTDAGVDFILIDCSNEIDSDLRNGAGFPYQKFEERALMAVFEEFASLPTSPKICILTGNPTQPDALFNGKLTSKADQIHDVFVSNPKYAPLLLQYLGKPLLVVFGQTPARYQDGLPPWSDDRFTIRFMTSFITQQPRLLGPRFSSKFGYWSWEDRWPPTYPVFDGHPEVMTVVAAWRDSKFEHLPPRGREGGETFRSEWRYARAIGPRFVLTGTFNEWKIGEQPSAEVSKDIEPSTKDGRLYLDILKQETALFKAGK